MFGRLGAAARACARPAASHPAGRFADQAVLRLSVTRLQTIRHQSSTPAESAAQPAPPAAPPAAEGTGKAGDEKNQSQGSKITDWVVDNPKKFFAGLAAFILLWVIRSNISDSREDKIVRALEAQSPISSKEMGAICRLNRLPTHVFAAAAAELLKAHAESGGQPIPLAHSLAVLRQFAQLQGFADALSDALLVQACSAAPVVDDGRKAAADPLRDALLDVAAQLRPVPSVPLGAPRAPDSMEPQSAAPGAVAPGLISREQLAAALSSALESVAADALPLAAATKAAAPSSSAKGGKPSTSPTAASAAAAAAAAPAPPVLLQPAPPFAGTFVLQRAAAMLAAVFPAAFDSPAAGASAASGSSTTPPTAAHHLPRWHPLGMIHTAEMRRQRLAAGASSASGAGSGSGAVASAGGAGAAGAAGAASSSADGGSDSFDELHDGPAEPRRGGAWLHDSKLDHALGPTHYIAEPAHASSLYRPVCPLPAAEACAAVGGSLSGSSSDAGLLSIGDRHAAGAAAASNGDAVSAHTHSSQPAVATVHPLLLLSLLGVLMGSAPELPIPRPPETAEAAAAAAKLPPTPPPAAPPRTLRSPFPTASQRVALYLSLMLGHRDLLMAAAAGGAEGGAGNGASDATGGGMENGTGDATGTSTGSGPAAPAAPATAAAAAIATAFAAALAAAPGDGGLALPQPLSAADPAACSKTPPAPLPVPLPPHLAIVPARLRERRYSAAEVCDLIDLLAATHQLPPRMRAYQPAGFARQWPLPRWQIKPSAMSLRQALEETGLLKDKIAPVTLLEGAAAANPPAPPSAIAGPAGAAGAAGAALEVPWRTWHAGGAAAAAGGPHVPPGHASAGGAADPLLAARAASGLADSLTADIDEEDARLPALSRDLNFEEVRRILVSRAVCAWGECLFFDDYRAGTRTSNRWLQQ